MARENALFPGHPVAAVAATTEAIAAQACALIDVDYEVLPWSIEIDDALKPDAPILHEFNTFEDKPSNITDHAPSMSQQQISQLQLDYEGRAGSLRAVDDHVKQLVETLRDTHQLNNTLIVFTSDNGWLQGQHRITGDKFLPYEESIRVPFVLRGPGVPAGETVHGQVSNIDFAPTLVDVAKAAAGRTMDGVSLMPSVHDPSMVPNRAIELEALAPLFEGNIPINAWDRPYKGVRTDRYTYVVYTETGDQELYDRQADPFELQNVADDPGYAAVKAHLAGKLAQLDDCKGSSCNVRAIFESSGSCIFQLGGVVPGNQRRQRHSEHGDRT